MPLTPHAHHWLFRIFRIWLCRRETLKTEIIFTGRIPSKKNSTRRVQRGKRVFTMASENYCNWESEHVSELRNSGIEALKPPYSIVYTIYAPDRKKADASNKIEGINDALVKAGILQDDNWFQLSTMAILFAGVDKQNPRVELLIESAK